MSRYPANASKNSVDSFAVKWDALAGATFLTLAVTSSVSLVEYLRANQSDLRGVPTLSAAVFASPYAREVFVLALLSIVFLTGRCGDVAASVTAWIFILAFHNSSNDCAHTIYASAAGALTVVLAITSPAVPRWLKFLVVLSAVVFAFAYLWVREAHSPFYISEYVCITLLVLASFYRVRSACTSVGSNSQLLCVAGC